MGVAVFKASHCPCSNTAEPKAMTGKAPSASRPCIFSGGMEVVRRAITVVSAQAEAPKAPTAIAFQSCRACGSSVIQATPTKAMTRPMVAVREIRSPSSRKANSEVRGIQSWVATVTGLTSWASQKAR